MKRIISILLSFILICSLAACSSQQAPETTAEAASETTAAAASSETVSEAATAAVTEPASEEAVDYSVLPFVKEGEDVTITIGIQQSALTEDYETNEYTKWLEEQTGVNIDFVYFSSDNTEAKQQFNLMLSSGEKLPDMFVMFKPMTIPMLLECGRDDYIIDLKPFMEKGLAYYWDLAKADYDERYPGLVDSVLATEADPETGAIYGWPRVTVNNTIDKVADFVWFNQVWADKLGVKIPTNVDELRAYLEAVVNGDPNGNGKKDEMGIVSKVTEPYRSDMLEWIINAYVFTNDSYLYNVTDGKVWLPYTTNEYRQALQYMNGLYKDGLISPLTFTIRENSEMTAVFTPADGVALAGAVSAHTTICSEKDNDVLFEYVSPGVLADETGRGGYRNEMAHTQNFQAFITTDCSNPEIAFRLLDFMGSEKSIRFSRYGIEGVHWEDCRGKGLKTTLGLDATFTVLDSSAYANQNNIVWHNDVAPGIVAFDMLNNSGKINLETWTGRRAAMTKDMVTKFETYSKPAEQLYYMNYDNEGSEVIAEYESAFIEYVKEARSQFVTGVLDPNNDAEWNKYLDACEKQGASKLLETVQKSYDSRK